MHASTQRIIQPFSDADCGFSIFEHIIGVRVSAMKLEKQTAAVMATANSVNSLPVLPDQRLIGMKTAASTSVVAITAKIT